MAHRKEIRLPDLGDFSDLPIIEILVAPGDQIEAEQSILTLESDKATMEIPAPQGGRVESLAVSVGDRVNPGDLLLTLVEAEEAGEEREENAEKPAQSPAPSVQETKGPSVAESKGTESLPVYLPDIGDFRDVSIIEILVAPGDQIEAEQSILTLESDKATMEIPAPQGGRVESLAVSVGDRVNSGDLLLTMAVEPDAKESPEAEAVPPPEPQQRPPGEKPLRQPPVLPRPSDLTAIAPGRKPHASPAVRRFARELGVDLSQVKGSGPKGRILKEDVQTYVQKTLAQSREAVSSGLPFSLPAAPEIDHARFGPVELRDLPRIKRLSGQHLHRCWLSVPQVTQFDEADITELETFRKAQQQAAADQGIRLTLLPFLLKAVAHVLEEMPLLKASLTGDGERLVWKQFTHIGVAVDTPQGLLVPVIRDVNRKGIYELARELAEISQKAREGKLLPGDLQGGVFSISSLGGIGGTAFTPIVNAPEAAILGVSRARMKPVWNGQEFVPRLLLPLSLSYDHRIVDGAEGVRFTTRLGTLLGDIRQLLL